jgi:hypothetical protein
LACVAQVQGDSVLAATWRQAVQVAVVYAPSAGLLGSARVDDTEGEGDF